MSLHRRQNQRYVYNTVFRDNVLLQDHVCRPPDISFTLSVHQQCSEYIGADQSLIKNHQSDAEAKEFVQDKLRSAMWLIKSIENRQKTIYKVSNSIVRTQQEFFKKGPAFLKPMILKDIANEIGMHESTVSRVTTNKFMHTPIGTFELKYFFNAGIGGKNGGIDIAGESLKLKIKEMVGHEDPKRPLSDQKISELLSTRDIIVARRTVAKYREMMGVAPSSKRKK